MAWSMTCAPAPLLTLTVELRALAEKGKAIAALGKANELMPRLNGAQKQALGPFFAELSWTLLREIETELDHGHKEQAESLAQGARVLVEGTSSRDDFESLLHQLFAPKPADDDLAPPGQTAVEAKSSEQSAKAHQAETLLRLYADELNMAENQLEREFLKSVLEGSEANFKRKEKLRNRLRKRTQWGGREPFKTTLKLLEAETNGNS
jgi:hypothetical protein